VGKGLGACKASCDPRFFLSFADAVDGGPEDFGSVSGKIQPERDDGHQHRTYMDRGEHHIEDNHQQNQNRCAAKKGDADMRMEQTAPPRIVPRIAARMEMITVTFNPSKTSL